MRENARDKHKDTNIGRDEVHTGKSRHGCNEKVALHQ